MRLMLKDNLSLAAFGGYSLSRSRMQELCDSVSASWLNASWFAGLQVGFHYTRVEDWDIYGGFSLAYQHIKIKVDDPGVIAAMKCRGIKPEQGNPFYTAFIGTRYALTGRISLFAELGYTVSLLQTGIGYSLRSYKPRSTSPGR